MNWPRKSPGLNPIEHLWDILEEGVKAHHTTPATLTELWTIMFGKPFLWNASANLLNLCLADVWQAIPVERFRKLVKSMPSRVAAVIKARGGQLFINLLSLIQ
ncbi:hypothetical protein AVEN_52887-1 [Araneus ventricosus]|uniref:Tc1-like transposase DDE domain-containing protein n=1 Tax=Araneus ventricosus TaxID=182803 RepID=A0A4Y2SSG4_ARAVE|nr:hypothetical protein AVEN_52887-1 [Araneus ventricosus]